MIMELLQIVHHLFSHPLLLLFSCSLDQIQLQSYKKTKRVEMVGYNLQDYIIMLSQARI